MATPSDEIKAEKRPIFKVASFQVNITFQKPVFFRLRSHTHSKKNNSRF